MTTLFLIVLANLLSRVLAVGLAAVLSFRIFSRYGNLVAAFAAGLLLTIACTHLIPEAVESGIDAHLAGGVLLGAFVFFMLLECFFSALGGHSHGDVKMRPVPVLLGAGPGWCKTVAAAQMVHRFLCYWRARPATALSTAFW